MNQKFTPPIVRALRIALGAQADSVEQDDIIFGMTPDEAFVILAKTLIQEEDSDQTLGLKLRELLKGLGLCQPPVHKDDIELEYTSIPGLRKKPHYQHIKQRSMEKLFALAISKIQGFDFIDVHTFEEVGPRPERRRFGIIVEIPDQQFKMTMSQMMKPVSAYEKEGKRVLRLS